MNNEDDKDWEEFIKTITPLEKNITIKDKDTNKVKFSDDKKSSDFLQDEEFLENIDENFSKEKNIIDKNLLRKIKRGKININATLDLHGQKYKESKIIVLNFIKNNFFKEKRLLLIITGKGKRSNISSGREFRGILKESVPKWLCSFTLSKYIIWFDEAGPENGGSGAILVYLKKIIK